MSRGRLFGSLCALVFLVNLARVVFAPLLEPLMAAFDASAASLGLVATLAWLGSALPRVPTGYLLTRVPRHHVVLGSGAILAVTATGTAWAPSVAVLGLGAFLMGIASGAYFIAANPLVSELYPDRVGRALGVHGMAAQVAAVAAPLLVTAVLFLGSWRTAFLLLGAVAFVATAALAAVSRAADLPDAGRTDRDLVAAIRRQWRVVLVGIAITGATGFVWNGVFNFYVTYLKVVKAMPETTARTLLTVVFAAGVPAFVLAGRLADRVPNIPLLLGIIAGVVLSLLALTAATGLVALVVVSLFLGLVVHSLFPAIDTYLLGTLPDEHRASAYAAYSGSMMLIQATGSSVVGALTDAGVPFDTVFHGFAGGLGVVLAVLFTLSLSGLLPTGARVGESTDRG